MYESMKRPYRLLRIIGAELYISKKTGGDGRRQVIAEDGRHRRQHVQNSQTIHVQFEMVKLFKLQFAK